MAGVQPSDAEIRAAVIRTGYVYTDPVEARIPGITAVALVTDAPGVGGATPAGPA